MERFKKFMGRELDLEKVKDTGRLAASGIECAYLPDPLEDFDEVEFRTGFGNDIIVITVAVELGKVKRIMISMADEKNPDMVRSLTGSQLEGFLAEKCETLVGFFEYVTG